MDILLNMIDELRLLEKLMKKNIEFLSPHSNPEIIALFKNHHDHLEMLLIKYLEKTKDFYGS